MEDGRTPRPWAEIPICSVGEAILFIAFVAFVLGLGLTFYYKGFSDGRSQGRKEAQNEIWEQEKNGHPFFELPQNEAEIRER